MSVWGDPEALSRSAAELDSVSIWARQRAADYQSLAESAASSAAQNDWVMRLWAGVIDHHQYMDELAVAATKAADVIRLLETRIRNLQHECTLVHGRQQTSPLGRGRQQTSPLHLDNTIDDLDYHATQAQQFRAEAVASLSHLVPGYQLNEWTPGPSAMDVGVGVWNFLVGDDLHTVRSAPGDAIDKAGEGDWLGASGALLGGIIAGAMLLPHAKLLKIGKVARLGDKAYEATKTAKLLEKARIAEFAHVVQVPRGVRPVWVEKVLGTDGRGYLAESVIYQKLLESNPSLVRLYWTHKKVDLYDDATKTLSSIKTLDPTAKKYLDNPAAFKEQVRRYVVDIRDWNDPRVKLWNEGKQAYDPAERVLGARRELVLGIPSEGLSEAHAQALREVLSEEVTEATGRNAVTVVIAEVQ